MCPNCTHLVSSYIIEQTIKSDLMRPSKWSRSVMPDSLWPHGLPRYLARLLCSWDFPGKYTRVGCHFLFQGIFPTQGSNLGFPHCRQTLQSEPLGKPIQVWPKSNTLQLHSGSDKQSQGIRSDRVPKELWMEICNIVQEAVIKLSPRKRNAKRQNGCLRRPYK